MNRFDLNWEGEVGPCSQDFGLSHTLESRSILVYRRLEGNRPFNNRITVRAVDGLKLARAGFKLKETFFFKYLFLGRYAEFQE